MNTSLQRNHGKEVIARVSGDSELSEEQKGVKESHPPRSSFFSL